jgi:hypothetical protein
MVSIRGDMESIAELSRGLIRTADRVKAARARAVVVADADAETTCG